MSMRIKIVTDSSADIPLDMAQKMGITVVPLYVRFGEEIFRERITITDEQFYEKLINGPVHPSTIQPSPQDFAEVYKKLTAEADAIVSIHISSKLSGTHNSAVLAKSMVENGTPITIIDSQFTSIALGLLVSFAADMASKGKDVDDILTAVNNAIPKIHLFGVLDTLKYLLLGGRIGKAKALVGSLLGVKPILTLKEGEVVPAGQARNRAKGIERLLDDLKKIPNVVDIAVGQNTTPEDAAKLAEQISTIVKDVPVSIARLGTTLGAHVGPGTLIIACREKV
jgi:DegV family protein with EDD domain